MKAKRIALVSLFSLVNVFIFVEALTPSEASAIQSESIADAIGGIIETVSKGDFSYTNLENITIKGPESVSISDPIWYHCEISPKNASFPSLIWESLNPDIAIVNQFGRVSGTKEGTAIIRVKSEENQDIFDTIEVTVESRKVIPPTMISIINTPKTLKKNISFLTSVETDVDPRRAMADMIYYSSDTSIATFENGVIKTYKAGSVELNVSSAKNNTASSSFNLEVLDVEGIKPSSIDLKLEETYYVNRKSEIKIEFSEMVEDENTRYVIEDESIASYDKGLIGIKEGQTSIKACRLFDESVCSPSYDVNVKNVNAQNVEVAIEGQETDLIVGKRLQLSALFTPIDVTSRNVTWSIDDEETARIGHSGLILGLETRTIRVSVQHEESGIIATKEFAIKKASTLTKLEKQELNGRIRKIVGHFGLFMINGVIGFFAFFTYFGKIKRQLLLAVSFGFGASIIAELLQLIPKGRSCQISDMGINFVGFLFGILIGYISYKIFTKAKHKKSVK